MMEPIFLIIQVIGLICGIAFILVAYQYRTPEHPSFLEIKPWSRKGINPLSPFTLSNRRKWWTPRGFRFHALGVLSFAAGIMAGIAGVLLRWLS
jgi:hypothetical protein